MKKENKKGKKSVSKKKINLKKNTKKNTLQGGSPGPIKNESVSVPKIEQNFKSFKVYNNAVAVWDFRISQDKITLAQLKEFLAEFAKRWVFQKEQGEETGYVHFQGRFSLIKRKRKSEVMNLFKSANFPIPNYIEPTSSNSLGNWFYVMKSETRIEGPWKDSDEEIYIPKHMQSVMTNPFPFQKQIVDSVKTDSEREVNVIYDPIGCSGKTTVASWLCTTSEAILVPMCYKTNDIIQYVCSLCIQKRLRNPSPIFIDLPRATPKNALQEVYAAVEILKSGLLYDTRFTGRRWVIESPSIWVFTNVEPDLTWLSKDRWKLWTIDDKKSLVLYNKF